MIERRRNAFAELWRLLRAVEADPDDLDAVRRMNLRLVREILRSERAIARHRDRLKSARRRLRTERGTRETNKAIRREIRRAEDYIGRYHRQRYVWKCFGDGLAYAYLDKYAVKHAFFETENYDVKRSAGMLGGKTGLAMEVAVLLSAIEHGVPAVLCDLTNTLRYGDVCLLGASDPCLLEVKSRPGLNTRGRRQADALRRLTEFLETDRAEDFRTPGVTRRVELRIPERSYRDAMNACIAEAAAAGWAVARPEPGLTYLATYVAPPDEAFAGLGSGGTQVFSSLNEEKTGCTWGIYEPFTLSIRDHGHLLDFVEGRLSLFVSFDADALCDALSQPGWDVAFTPDVPAAIQFHHRETGALMGVSMQFLGRIAFEFVAPSWVAETQAPNLDELGDELLSTTDGPAADERHDALRVAMFGPRAGGAPTGIPTERKA